MNTLAMLFSDTYKQCHPRMYVDGLEFLASYLVPRRSMLENTKEMVWYGLQYFNRRYLVEYFNNYFFKLSEEEVIKQYENSMNIQIGEGNYDTKNIVNLHRLGYLPLRIRALPEGSRVPMGVPCVEITNTHKDFAWVVQWIECILQVELWKPCFHATVGDLYRQEANYWYDKTVDDMKPEMACADFGMRGMSCMEEAVKCSSAWLLSFNKTSTIPAIEFIDKYYDANCADNGLGKGAVSVEHSVVGAWYAVHGDERSLIHKLLTSDYPDTSFSYVADTYDYWDIVNNVIPSLKEEILTHNGKLLIRPDSGDMVDIAVRTVQALWDCFGGTVNSKGYKVLDPHIGIIYGDGCSLKNVREVWEKYEELGFAANNIFFGVGAFCFTALIENGKMVVGTRDTFGMAMKATYGVVNGKEIHIYKDPKTDTSKLKKSHKGCCIVRGNVHLENGHLKVDYSCTDGHSWNESLYSYDNVLETVFKDGELVQQHTTQSFMAIRHRLHMGGIV